MNSEAQNHDPAGPKPAAATGAPPMAAPAAPPAALLPAMPEICQNIVDSVQEGVVIYDRDLRYRLWNPFMQKITGQSAREVLGKRATEVHGFVKEHGLDKLLERALAGFNGFFPDTHYSQKRTNWTGCIAGQFTPLRDEKGAVYGVLAVVHDTTRRKRMEEAQLAHEQSYRRLFDENSQPMWVQDVETLQFLAVNEAALRHYGYSRAEFLFMTIEGLLPPADTAARSAVPRGGAGPGGSVDESRVRQHRLKSGKIIDVEINSNVVTFAGRRAVLVMANDVTERLRAQRSLRENELKYRTLIEAADVAIFLSDAVTGQILEANRRAETLLGLARHQIVGMQIKDLSPPEMAATQRISLLRASLPTGNAGLRAYVWHRAGRRIPVDIITSVMEIGGRKVVQGIYRDITERKRAEETLAQRSRQLEVLARANRQIHAVLEVPVILRKLVSAACELIHASAGMAGLVSDGKLAFNEYLQKGKPIPVSYRFDPGQGVAGYVLSTRLTYCSNDPANDPLVIPDIQKALKIYNLVCIPILTRDNQLFGCVEIHNTLNQRAIEETDLTMLEVLAAGAAIAIENACSLALHAALLESVPDGILVVDERGKMVNFNQKFVHMWRIPKAIVESRDDSRAIEFVLTQVKDPEGFTAKVKELYAQPDTDCHDSVEFKDGRVFERFSSPRRVAGVAVGRVWTFRDITAQQHPKPSRSASRPSKKPRNLP